MWERYNNAIGTRQNMSILNTVYYNGVKVDILQYEKLLGTDKPSLASTLYFMNKENIKARQLAVYLENDGARFEAGAMSYFQGNVEMVSGLTMGNAVGKMFKGAVTGESAAKPLYKGTGMIVSEISFKHFIPFTLEKGETVIVDKGMFYLASESVKVEPYMQQNVSSALLGGEGIFQIQMTGPGLVICESKVPMEEIDVINLNNDMLKVDGNFAVLRTEGVTFSVERSAKTLMGSAMSGEGLVNVYRGTGQVWLAPTLKVYPMI